MSDTRFAAIFLALVALATTGRPAAAGIPVIFDQGPSTGALGPCFDNQADADNWADQVDFVDGAVVQGIAIYVPSDPGPVVVHTRIFADDGTGSPGALLREEDNAALVEPVPGELFRVAVAFLAPFIAEAGTTYWYGLSASPSFELMQCTVLSPGDGRIARFSGPVFVGHDRTGDQMFALLGELLPVELQSFSVE